MSSKRFAEAVLHAIQKIQRLRCDDESVDALIEVLTGALREDAGRMAAQSKSVPWTGDLIETVTARVLSRLAERQAVGGWSRRGF